MRNLTKILLLSSTLFIACAESGNKIIGPSSPVATEEQGVIAPAATGESVEEILIPPEECLDDSTSGATTFC